MTGEGYNDRRMEKTERDGDILTSFLKSLLLGVIHV